MVRNMRTDVLRTKKYKAKLSGENVAKTIHRYGSVQKANFAARIADMVEIEQKVKAILNKSGIPPLHNHYYMNFAKKIVRLTPQEQAIEMTKQYQRGLNSTILYVIGKAVANTKIPMTPVTDLMGYWHFDEEATDYSGYGNHGLILGPTNTAGVINEALYFDGLNDSISCGVAPNLDLTDAITIEAWINAPSGAGDYMLVKFLIIGPLWSGFLVRAGQAAIADRCVWGIFPNPGPVAFLTSIGNLATGTWHHLVCTYDRANMIIYIDGGLDNSIPENRPIAPPIGGNLFFGSFFGMWGKGSYDEVRIYNRALTPSEINTHYNIERALHGV